METFAAVVVTHNRLALLKLCINGLRQQSLPLHAIIVINNSSTDGTARWLESQPDLTVVHQENGGGAAGFYRGMKEAWQRNFSYIWVMDDDVVPADNCLEEMVNGNRRYDNRFDVLQPDRKFYNSEAEWRYGSKFNFSNPFKAETLDPVRASEFPEGESIRPIVSFPFEGPMFSRRVIEKVGFADRHYFIFYDDTDYSARVHKAGFSVGLVKNAVMTKMVNPEAKGISADWKFYYRIRNQILLDRRFGNRYIAVTRAACANIHRILALIKLSVRNRTFAGFPGHLATIKRAVTDAFRYNIHEQNDH